MTCLGFNYYNGGQPDSAIYFYTKALPLLEKAQQPYYLSFLYITIADYYGTVDQPAQQLEYLKKSWDIRLKLPEKLYLPHVGVRLAAFYSKRRDIDKALAYLDRAQANLASDTLNNEEISIINKQRASILAKEGYLVKALQLFNQSKKFFQNQSLDLELTDLLLESAEVLEDVGSYEAGLKNSFEALTIANKNDYKYERTKILVRIAWFYFELNNLQLSKKFAAQALQAARQGHYIEEEATTLNLNGLITMQEGNLKESSNYFENALAIRQKINDQDGIASTLSNIGWGSPTKVNMAKPLTIS
jgi:tetratricopeptide (TPR) repeat protein